METDDFSFDLNVNDPDKKTTNRSPKIGQRAKFPPNLDEVIRWIQNREDFSPEQKDHLIKIANKHPHGALEHFIKNINVHLKSLYRN